MRLMRVALVAVCGIAMAMPEVASAAGPMTSDLARAGKLPKLTQPRAERYARSSLRHKFSYYPNAYGKKVRCNKRVSRVRLRCKVKFVIGDTYVHGHVTAYYRFHRGDVWWFTKGRVKVVDEYCIYGQDKPRSECTDTKTWGR
jgi:hypothetical protein